MADVGHVEETTETTVSFGVPLVASVSATIKTAAEQTHESALARCHLALAELHADAGRADAVRAELSAAGTLFASMGMTSWKSRVDALEVRPGS